MSNVTISELNALTPRVIIAYLKRIDPVLGTTFADALDAPTFEEAITIIETSILPPANRYHLRKILERKYRRPTFGNSVTDFVTTSDEDREAERRANERYERRLARRSGRS